jgi:hypothetical protein
MAAIEIEDRILVGEYDADIPGYTWTLVSRLGDMLVMAEELYGARNMDYTILGIEFVEDSQCVYYPGDEQYNQILIHLPVGALKDYDQCLYMAAHETVHCLSPRRDLPATRLEEGLAANFARLYMGYAGLGEDWSSSDESYNEAQRDVEDLLAIDGDIIKKVRSLQPVISLISRADLLEANGSLPEELIERLVAYF